MVTPQLASVLEAQDELVAVAPRRGRVHPEHELDSVPAQRLAERLAQRRRLARQARARRPRRAPPRRRDGARPVRARHRPARRRARSAGAAPPSCRSPRSCPRRRRAPAGRGPGGRPDRRRWPGRRGRRCGGTPSTSTTPVPARRPVAAQQVDPSVGQPALLAGVGVVRDHEVAPGQRRLHVDLALAPPPRARRAPPRPGAAATSTGCTPSRSTRRRRARARRPRPAARPPRGRGAVLAGRPATEDDHVVVVVTRGAPRRPARGPCRRRTSPASSDPLHRCASRARRARPRRAAAPPPDRR